MTAGPRMARGQRRAAAALLCSILLASCSANDSPQLRLASTSFTGPAGGEVLQPPETGTVTEAYGGGDAALPQELASPAAKPDGDEATAVVAAPAVVPGAKPELPAAAEPTAAGGTTEAAGPVLGHGGAILTTGVMPQSPSVEPKKKSFLSAFFGASPATATEIERAKPLAALAAAKPEPKPEEKSRNKPEEESVEEPVQLASLGEQTNFDYVLPGVRQEGLFEIKRKSGLDDDSDVDLHEFEGAPPVRLASAAGLARMAPNGLLKQRDSVDVGCLKPNLVRMLKVIESHFGKKMVVTSGYRSPAHNKRVNGARKSMHMFCAAVDVQIAGVSKWELASFARSLPGRGGVGTYCHTASVHIDVGPERDWNWRCRRGKS